ncbi:hypothetical protein [Chitinimonas sp.]|uniref:hypothetical protein n=1 Tax=Chitinimonas sp. TaxID=1934313 RepID=UPI0035AEFE0B
MVLGALDIWLGLALLSAAATLLYRLWQGAGQRNEVRRRVWQLLALCLANVPLAALYALLAYQAGASSL